MANTGQPNSGGSQFFLNVANNANLDWFNKGTSSSHPVFGKLDNEESLALVRRITEVRTRSDRPVAPIEMISVRVDTAVSAVAPSESAVP